MSSPSKTNAARLLDRAGIPYTLVPYKVDPDNLAAEHVAAELGEDINRMFKTLVLHGDKVGHFVCVVRKCRGRSEKAAASPAPRKPT